MVFNAVLSCVLENDPDRMREMYMDDHYSSLTLFVLLEEKYQILASGTIPSNRKGWDTKVMICQRQHHKVHLRYSMTKQVNCKLVNGMIIRLHQLFSCSVFSVFRILNIE